MSYVCPQISCWPGTFVFVTLFMTSKQDQGTLGLDLGSTVHSATPLSSLSDLDCRDLREHPAGRSPALEGTQRDVQRRHRRGEGGRKLRGALTPRAGRCVAPVVGSGDVSLNPKEHGPIRGTIADGHEMILSSQPRRNRLSCDSTIQR